MKIMIITSFFRLNRNDGGTQLFTNNLIEFLLKNGDEVTILMNSLGEIDNEINLMNPNIKILRYNEIVVNNCIWNINNDVLKWFFLNLRNSLNVVIKKDIKRLILQNKPDVIHMQNIYSLSPILWKWLKRKKIPVVYSLHDCFLLCPLLFDLKKCNSSTNDIKVCNNRKILCHIYQSCNRQFSNEANYVIAPTKATLALHIQNGFFDRTATKVIKHEIDGNSIKNVEIMEMRMSRIMNGEKCTYLYIGRLDDSKGLYELISVFKKIKGVHHALTIAGDGVLSEDVKYIASNDQRITFLGYVEGRSKEQAFLSSDVLIMNSMVFETFGYVLIEAMSYGLPIIAPKRGGIVEVVKHDVNGYLFEAGNMDALLECMELINNKKDMEKMSRNNFNYCKKFDYTKNIREYYRVYLDVILNND